MKMSQPQNVAAISQGAKPREAYFNLTRFNPVLLLSSAVILIVLLVCLFAPEWAKGIFVGGRRWSVIHLDWLFMLSANLLLGFSLVLAVSPLGKRRLGSESVQFSNFAWYSMIVMTGVGLTLVFWGVTEPAAFYTDWWGVPFNQEARSQEAESLALAASLYHWGLHPWAIYTVMGLAIAYAAYNKGLPLKFSSIFYPFLKQQTHRLSGNVLDTLAVVATVFGVATTMGLGARQAAKSLEYLYAIPNTLISQSVLILVASLLLFLVMHLGLVKGIKKFSLANLILACVFALALVVLAGLTNALSVLGITAFEYANNFIAFSQWSERTDLKFFHGWTIFYWIWWFSWAPFIGLFIARISKGRSIRECVFAILIIPSLFSLFWFSALGGIGLEQISQGIGSIMEPRLSPTTALFKMLEILPFTQVLAFIGIVLVLICFVSTSNASVYSLELLTRNTNQIRSKKVSQFWVLIQACVALSLLVFGGKKALESAQSASLLIGVLLCFLLLIASVGLIYNLKKDKL